tara:strand:- start:784 stop:1989 length:1206 start_codon:yes stop_codon:yes gene_type:complete
MVLRKSRKKSPVRRRRSPVRRSRSPVRRRKSPVRRRRSPVRRRKSPARRRRLPARRRKSPTRRRKSPTRRRKSPVRRRRSPARRRKSPARRRKSPARRRRSPARRRKSRPYVEGIRNSELRRYGLGPNKWYNYRADIDPLEKYHYEDIIQITDKGSDVVYFELQNLDGYIGDAINSIDVTSNVYNPNTAESNHPVQQLNKHINETSLLEEMFVTEKSPIRLNIDTSATGDDGKINETLYTLERLVHIYFTFLCPLFGKNNQNKKEITIYEHFQSLIKASRPTLRCPILINNIKEYKDKFITNGILDHAIKHRIISLKQGGNKRRKLKEDLSVYRALPEQDAFGDSHEGGSPAPPILRRQHATLGSGFISPRSAGRAESISPRMNAALGLTSLFDAAANDDE